MNLPIFRAIMASSALGLPGGGGGLPATGHSLLDVMLANSGGTAEIYRVTSLSNDAATAGTFPHAVTTGNANVVRIVVFDVSGECLQPSSSGATSTDIREPLSIERENLWIAGQTAPDPGDGSGRGFNFGGQLKIRTTWIVIEHIRAYAIIGDPGTNTTEADANAVRWTTNTGNGSRAGANKYVCMRNCTFRWSLDTTVDHGGWHNPSPSWPEVSVIDNCYTGDGCHINIFDGTGGYAQDGNNRAWNLRQNLEKCLFRGNLISCSSWRSPQIAQGAKVLGVNNYTFNYGGGRATDDNPRQWPWTLAPKHDGTATNYPMVGAVADTALKVSVHGNYCEAGNKTEHPPEGNGDYWLFATQLADSEYAAAGNGFGNVDPTEVYDDGTNKVISYYDPTTVPDADTDPADATNPNLAGTPYYEAFTVEPNVASLTYPGAHIYTLPDVLYLADEVRQHCLDHAGAWPVARDTADAAAFTAIENRTHTPIGGVPAIQRAPTTTSGAMAIPNDPGHATAFGTGHPLFATEANGLKAIENWLVARHIDAGGCPETAYVAGEWWSRW